MRQTLRALFLILAASFFTNCKSSSTSASHSLQPNDIERIFSGKRDFDLATRKYFVAIYNENRLSSGAASFFDAYQSLIKTNIGEGYKTFVLTNMPKDNYSSSPLVDHQLVGNRRELLVAMQRVVETIKNETSVDGQRSVGRVEIIFHLLAHGATANSTGDGFFGIDPPPIKSTSSSTSTNISSSNGLQLTEDPNARLTWSDLWSEVIQPLSEAATETIAVLGSCFSGNTMAHLPRALQTQDSKSNLLVIASASPFTTAYATGVDVGYTTSILSEAVVSGLRGFANDTSNAQKPYQASGFEAVVAKYNLRDIDTVTSNELIAYVNSYVQYKSCLATNANTNKDLFSQLCQAYELGKLGTDAVTDAVLTGVLGNSTSQQQQLEAREALRQGNLEAFKRTGLYHAAFMPTEVQVFRTPNPRNSLAAGQDVLLAIASAELVREQNLQHKDFRNYIEPLIGPCVKNLAAKGDDFVWLFQALERKRSSGSFAAGFDTKRADNICHDMHVMMGNPTPEPTSAGTSPAPAEPNPASTGNEVQDATDPEDGASATYTDPTQSSDGAGSQP